MAGPTPAWNTVQVFKHCRFFDGTACSGIVKFTPTRLARDVPNKITVYPRSVQATLDSTGSYSVELPATDDPDIAGSFAYVYDESWEGGEKFTFQLPLSTPPAPFDMGTATPVVPGDAFTTYLTTEAFAEAVATDLVQSEQIRDLVRLTQAQYDSIATPSPTALYVIVG